MKAPLSNLLAGGLLVAWLGVGWTTRMHHRKFYRVIAVLLLIAAVLVTEHWLPRKGTPLLPGPA